MSQPTFSAVIAAYQIEKYADDLFRSIERQTIASDRLEIVFIDDGSEDLTLTKAREWASKSRFQVTVESQVNMGVAAARNNGINISKGHWIAFVDSDDVLDRRYFEALDNFLERDVNDSASILTSRSLIFSEQTGTAQDNHPLAWKYRKGDRLVNMNVEPNVIHLAGHATIVRSDVVKDNGIQFSSLVKPAFEDAHFIGVYLAQFAEPIIGLVASARYYYRKRADGSSLIDTTWLKPEKYTNETQYGHLGLLKYLYEKNGYVPLWAQNTVLYSLYWFFRADRMIDSPLKSVDQGLLDRLWESLYEIFEFIDASTIRDFNLVNYGWALKEGILRHFKGESIVPSSGYVGYMWNADDVTRSTRKVGYTYYGEMQRERIFLGGTFFDGAVTKSIRHTAFGRTLMYERVVILPRVRKVEIYLDGKKIWITKPISDRSKQTTFESAPKHLQLSAGTYHPSASEMVRRAKKSTGRAKLRHGLTATAKKITEESWITGQNRIRVSIKVMSRVVHRYKANRSKSLLMAKDKIVVASARSQEKREMYQDSWIVMDHPVRADDNGEHFYRFLHRQHPEIRAFFMLKRSSKDWTRLESEGFNLVEYGSERAVHLTLNAKYIISSHIDAGIYDPVNRGRFGASPAKRIFLQHGLAMNDLSRWLNTKGLAQMISSSPKEYDFFTGDGSPYKFTSKEVALTGLPRHDALVRAKSTPGIKRNYLSFVPTWRQHLVGELKKCSTIQSRSNALWSSDFYKSWNSVLNDATLASIAESGDMEIVFVLHDHFAQFRDLFDFGPNVKVRTFSELKVQEFLLCSAILVTDYSSIATEAAITGSPVSYFQFDMDSIFSTGHTFTKGWFSYKNDGFGPVVTEAADLVQWIANRFADDWEPEEEYTARLEETLPYLDGLASERVFGAIQSLDERLFIGEFSDEISG